MVPARITEFISGIKLMYIVFGFSGTQKKEMIDAGAKSYDLTQWLSPVHYDALSLSIRNFKSKREIEIPAMGECV